MILSILFIFLTGTALNTVLGQCPLMYQPTFGRIDSCDNSVGSVCRIRCQPGYELLGNSILKCNQDGVWSGNPPSCIDRQIVCRQTPALPPHAELPQNCPNYLGSQCRLRCKRGYALVGNGAVTCNVDGEDAIWIVNPGQCRRVRCRRLRSPNNGYFVNKCKRNVGAQCVIGCRPPYIVGGTNVRRCLPNGRWTGARNACIMGEQCPSITGLNGGRVSGVCQPGIIGESCQFSCNAGYQLIGLSNILCLRNGSWSGPPPTCQAIVCPSLPVPQNGKYNGICSPGQPNQWCNFECNEGYTMSGSSNLLCRANGTWSNPPPTCQVSNCPAITNTEEGIVSGTCSPGIVGQSCYFSCKSGYNLIGPNSIVCRAGGIWSTDPPYCEKVNCPPLNAPANGIQSGVCSPGEIGQWCYFQCNNGFVLSGNENLLCRAGGVWSGTPPLCQRRAICPVIQLPNNANLVNCNNEVGGVCVVKCNQGYIQSGSNSLVCLANGQWSGNIPICKRRYVTTTTTTYRVVPLWVIWLGKR
ncbi:P-selectin-like [Centruroides vittatus]|uniref:P-selectin-like n=1 Tax=Centruroides vittatus TaxID=120091 RepID=UPI00350F0C79